MPRVMHLGQIVFENWGFSHDMKLTIGREKQTLVRLSELASSLITNLCHTYSTIEVVV